jgi:hypothetical protein
VSPAKYHEPGRARDHEPAPQRPVSVEGAAAREVTRGHRGHRHALPDLYRLPPVEVSRSGHPLPLEERRVPEADEHGRRTRGGEPSQRRDVHVVVVVVADEHRVERRQILEPDARRTMPPRPDPRERRDAVRPHRSVSTLTAVHLDQHGRVVDEGDAERSPADALGRLRGVGRVDPVPPRSAGRGSGSSAGSRGRSPRDPSTGSARRRSGRTPGRGTGEPRARSRPRRTRFPRRPTGRPG